MREMWITGRKGRVAIQIGRDLLTGLVALGVLLLLGGLFVWIGRRSGDLLTGEHGLLTGPVAVQISLALVALALAWILGTAINRGLFSIAGSKLRRFFVAAFPKSILARTEVVVRVSMEKVKADKYELAGSFLTIPLDVVLETLSAAWKTGLLSIDCEGRFGRVYFENGNVVAVRFDGIEDRDAFQAIYRQAKGYFLFHAGRVPPQRTMHSPVVPLLKEVKRATEESAESTAHRTIRPTSFKS